MKKLLILIAIFIPITQALVLNMVAPIKTTVYNSDNIKVGPVSPGQLIKLQFDTYTGEYGTGKEDWDNIAVIDIPKEWKYDPAAWQDNRLQVIIHIPQSATPGEYTVKLQAQDYMVKEKEFRNPPITFNVKIDVENNVIDVTPQIFNIYTSKPFEIPLLITNRGMGNDTLIIGTDLPETWTSGKTVLITPKQTIKEKIRVDPKEPGDYTFKLYVKSITSNETYEYKMNLVTYSNILKDLKAQENGVLIFPQFQAPYTKLINLIWEISNILLPNK